MSASSQNELSQASVQDVGSRYFLPRNMEEAERMQNQHEWLKGGADGLVLAPIDLTRSGMRVLDSATADGRESFPPVLIVMLISSRLLDAGRKVYLSQRYRVRWL